MSEPVTTAPDLPETLERVDPTLRFEGKFKLSIGITPDRLYLTTADGMLAFTTDASKALTFALYRVTNSDVPNTFMVQGTPPIDVNPPPWAGAYFALWGSADDVAAGIMTEYRLSTQFVCDFSGNNVRFFARAAQRYMLARRNERGTCVFWLPPKGSMWDTATWQIEFVQRWNDQNMDGADLRYVSSLSALCRGKNSYIGAKLYRADFARANVRDSIFRNASCEYAYFIGTTLTGASFDGAVVRNAYFEGAQAQNASFPNVVFAGARFWYPNAQRTSFAGASLGGAVFDDCDVAGVDFTGATLDKAQFKKATVDGADFSNATLVGAAFDDAHARRAKFVNAKLTGASFARADFAPTPTQPLPRVDFTGATLYEIDFSGCDLTTVTIARPAKFLENDTIVPDANHRRARLRSATVPIEVIGTTSWRMLDLTGARIVGALPKTLTGFVGDWCIFPVNYDLTGSDISKAKFRNATMRGIQLDNAKAPVEFARDAPDFTNADLTSAHFWQAKLPDVVFDGATMHGINLSYAALDRASFLGSRLDSTDSDDKPPVSLIADLSHARLIDASFVKAFLGKGSKSTGANLTSATFFGDAAKITDATLDGAQFTGAYLAGVDFTGGSAKSMEGVNFAGACLANSKLNKASLLNANLSDACLLGANFRDAALTGAMMSGANVSFQKITLVANRPDGRVSELACEPTVIETKATDGQTTCPVGIKGPCEGAMWTRKGGAVGKWPLSSTTEPKGTNDGD